ncbi:hypothetical protein [Cloacibacillus evryensis]|uniref:hypothetical protein n=1 Tax=Cloacibacillus evryensis TaxID=508460 RepID=UPI00210F05C3|nr:hypothetical protein [Cloacibacillus evryensis]MCQ4763311.1 hypothetical protein [Cloacibacillus evryensis]
MKKLSILTIAVFIALISLLSQANADSFDNVLKSWSKTQYFQNDMDGNLTIKCIYYSAEYIEAYIQSEAKKNLWTQSETEDFKYKFLTALNLDETIPIYIEFENNGPTMYLGPFDNMVTLRINNKVYKPVEYDKRFNFKFQGKKDGLVFFPRYDQKTGKDLLEGVKTVRLDFKPAISVTLEGKSPFFLWDINKDNPAKLYQGTTAARMETNRLIKRLEKLRKDKAEEEAKLASINGEISTIQTRLDELAKQ